VNYVRIDNKNAGEAGAWITARLNDAARVISILPP
jgi:hypothetical protein